MLIKPVFFTFLLVCACDLQAQTDEHTETDRQSLDNELKHQLSKSLDENHGFTDQFDAQVWFKTMLPRMNRFRIEDSEKLEILGWVHREAKAAQLDPLLVLALIEIESSFDRYAVSRAGAQGLMQVMSFWKQEIGRNEDNLINTETNLRYGTTILAHYLKRADGDITEALSRYNGSFPKTWYAERVYKALDRWR